MLESAHRMWALGRGRRLQTEGPLTKGPKWWQRGNPRKIFQPEVLWLEGVFDTSLEGDLQNGMATHSSFLAWRVPMTEESGRLQSMGSQRVGHSWATFTSLEGGIENELLRQHWRQGRWWEGWGEVVETEGRNHLSFSYNSVSCSPSMTGHLLRRCHQASYETKLERIVSPANRWQHHNCGNMLFKSDLTSDLQICLVTWEQPAKSPGLGPEALGSGVSVSTGSLCNLHQVPCPLWAPPNRSTPALKWGCWTSLPIFDLHNQPADLAPVLSLLNIPTHWVSMPQPCCIGGNPSMPQSMGISMSQPHHWASSLGEARLSDFFLS